MEFYHDTGSEGEVAVKEEPHDEKTMLVLARPAVARSEPNLDRERPHMILPDAWLETSDSEIIEQGERSNKICFGMVCMLLGTLSITLARGSC